MRRESRPIHWLGVIAAALLAFGCPDEGKPRLYQTYEVPPDGLVTDVPPSLLDQVEEGQAKVTLTRDDIEQMRFLGPSLVQTAEGQFRGINFSVFSQRAEKVRLMLFDDPESSRVSREIDMTRIGDVWNVFVEGVGVGQHYGYVAWGPNWQYDPRWYPGSTFGYMSDVDNAGNRFNPNKLLIDPYCKALHRDHDWGRGSAGTGPYRAQSTLAAAAKCVVVKSQYSWGEAEAEWRRQRREGTLEGHAWNDLILYEVHAKGFTANTASGVTHPGTFRGFGEKADYFKELGITAVEVLPPFEKPLDGGYWGYNNLSYFAPEISYASKREREEVIDEFKWMVEELHKRGIEVIVDVVFNHTGEGGLWREKIFQNQESVWSLDPEETASLFSFRGLDNASYYALSPHDPREYCDYTGVGNTMRCNNAPVKRLIIDSLRYWVEELHVDGYRFDLAPALGAKDGEYRYCPTSANKGSNKECQTNANCPEDEYCNTNHWEGPRCQKTGITWDPKSTVVQEIVDDPVLRKNNTRIIAEPWGAGGYPVGQFVASSANDGFGWGEWNNRFRDWWRSFANYDDWPLNKQQDGADGGSVTTGSASMFQWNGRRPYHSINFVTCHDGMTMYDLVSYADKVNDCSPLNPVCCTSPMSSFCQEAKKSGTDDNRSRNWGSAGEDFKRQLMRNWFVAMMISHGTPMIFGGDEWLRTQLGNNNTYTPEADNPYSWHDWGAWQAQDDRWRMYDFVSKAIAFRKANASAFAPAEYGQSAPFSWKTYENRDASGDDWGRRSLMIHYYDSSRGSELAILINMEGSALDFQLPGGKSWHRVIDTQLAFDRPSYLAERGIGPRTSGNIDLEARETVPGSSYGVQSRSIVVLEAK